MKFWAVSFFILLFLLKSAYSQNIAIVSFDQDGLIEKGFRDEILLHFPEARFYTFGCSKDIKLLRSYYPFIKKINPDILFVNGKEALKDIYKHKIFSKTVIFHIKGNPVKENFIADVSLPAINATGVSTEISILEQIKVIRQLKKLRKLGVLKLEEDSEYLSSISEIRRLSAFFDFAVEEIPVSKLLKDESIINGIDVVYIPYTQIPGIETIDIINRHKIPSLAENDSYVLNQGVLLALVVDEYRSGRFAGQKAVKILKGASAKTMPVTLIEHFMVVLNLATAKKIEYQVPIKFLIIADKIVR
ncbi:MAG: hypothetical protein PWQ25_1511 [Deferribacteres bacterium]|jgi:putative ABC transport system substrate-binding protein|nr:hypothetical protein [Deferribacteres bacterium]